MQITVNSQLTKGRCDMKRTTLKDLREKRGLTQEEVAKLTNKTTTFIWMLENGKRNASDDMKRRLAKIYNCEIAVKEAQYDFL